MTSKTTEATGTRSTCRECGSTILRNRDGLWFSKAASGLTSNCPIAPEGAHIPAVEISEMDALRAGNARLQGEVERLSNENTHLSRRAETLRVNRDQLRDKRTEADAEIRELRAKLHAVALVKVWKNEDGKRFVFADDLFRAIEGDVR